MPAPKFIVAGLLILGAVSYLMFSGINDTMVYYYTVSELLADKSDLSGKGVRINGHVSPGKIQLDRKQSRVDFTVLEKSTSLTLPVTYQGIIPDTFKDGAEVVVEGVYFADQHQFKATTLLAKCPSKYEEAQADYSAEDSNSNKPY